MALSNSPKQPRPRTRPEPGSTPRKVGELYIVVAEGSFCCPPNDTKNGKIEDWNTFIQANIDWQEDSTPIGRGRHPTWNKKIKFDIWNYHFSIVLQLFRIIKDKTKKLVDYTLPLDVRAISSGQLLNIPFCADKKKSPIALVKLFLQFVHITHEYSRMENLILDNPPVLGAIIDTFKSSKGVMPEELCSSIYTLFSYHNRQLELQKYIITHEIERINDINLMFRADTLGIQLISEFMNEYGTVFLDKISDQIVKVMSPKISIELDPDLLKPGEDLLVNQKRLTERADALLEAVLQCQKYIHPNIRELCKYIMVSISKRCAIDSKLSQEQIKRDSFIAMGAILFLRYICPCVIRSCVSIDRRSTILLAKVVTAIANNVCFGEKEPFMCCMNDYVKSKRSWIEAFFTKILNNHSTLDAQPYQQEPVPFPIYKQIFCFLKDNQQTLVDHMNRFKTDKENPSNGLTIVLSEMAQREAGQLHSVASLSTITSSASLPIATKVYSGNVSPTSSPSSPSTSPLHTNSFFCAETINNHFMSPSPLRSPTT